MTTAVRKYVHRTISKEAETKIVTAAFEDFRSVGALTTYVYCPSWQIPQGDGGGERIGRRISNAYVRLSVGYAHNGEDFAYVNYAEASWIRMLVIRSRAIKTAGVTAQTLQVNPVNLQVGNIFYHTGAQNNIFSNIEKRTWTVIKDVKWMGHRGLDGGIGDLSTRMIPKKFKIPLGKSCTFILGDNYSHFVGPETYIVFIFGAPGIINGTNASFGATHNVGTISVTGEIYFKDS